MTVAKAIARAWNDLTFKSKLKDDPHGALAEHGVEVPEGQTIKVVENTDDTVHLVLPAAPPNSEELNVNDLEKVAGGLCGITTPTGSEKPSARTS